ncbi:hypothetical protein AVEN_80953-1 [Araneus ventricosus]|uniref:Uncharacterized protein n=1 Tax=Araneus ventricosus TaxID=182803 RepID=A0A4Y2T2X7_ARAVE|nr:hypothetical protein AVEN_80953-1 [Araneus ventricosus]
MYENASDDSGVDSSFSKCVVTGKGDDMIDCPAYIHEINTKEVISEDLDGQMQNYTNYKYCLLKFIVLLTLDFAWISHRLKMINESVEGTHRAMLHNVCREWSFDVVRAIKDNQVEQLLCTQTNL